MRLAIWQAIPAPTRLSRVLAFWRAVLVAAAILLAPCADLREAAATASPADTPTPKLITTPCPTDTAGERRLRAVFWYSADVNQVRAELRDGANIEAKTDNCWTPLHWAAAWNDKPAVVQLLLDHGANIEARTRFGRTPLHLAPGRNDH